MNNIFLKKYNSWRELEKEIEGLATAYERGEAFEEFAFLYFKIRSTYHQVENIWRVADVPSSVLSILNIERSDAGVDGLIKNVNGSYTAYQVKFRSNRKKPSYSELTKFWQEGRNCDFHLTFSNCNELTPLCSKNPKHLQVLSLELDGLEEDFFSKLVNLLETSKLIKMRFMPYEYQEKMILDVVEGFRNTNRGKLIAACGTGKTLTALWISERLKSKKILFIAPSIALIKQTLRSWSDQTLDPFQYICICSDISVADNIDDTGDLNVIEFGVPVTTDPELIADRLRKFGGGVSVVFSTYQSLGALRSAVKLANYKFELAFFDEAHRTAGANSSDSFSLALLDENIPIEKRLFMTATQRLIKPAVLKKAAQLNRVVFSMDDNNIYGRLFHRFSFGEAIQQKVIADYRIVIAGVRSSQIYEWIKDNKILVDLETKSQDFKDSASNIFKQILLFKVMQKFQVKKTVSFHNSIKLAKQFVFGNAEFGASLSATFRALDPKVDMSNYFFSHINGGFNASSRQDILNEFKDSESGIVSNSRCLTEGVDVPIIDSIYFVDPRNSLVDIVQACGRALRIPRNGDVKLAYFIIPILIPDGDPEDALNKIDYDMIHMLIQSLRDQDSRLDQWVEKLNLSLVKPSLPGNEPEPGFVECFLPTEFNIQKFEKHIYARIGDVNKNPEESALDEIKKLKSRKSGIKRVFRTIGDYGVDSYYSSLIKPALEEFHSPNQIIEKQLISGINNNAVSHGIKLGAFEETGSGKFQLTEVGKIIKSRSHEFNKIFGLQILKYFEISGSKILFPYREILKLLCEYGSISYFEFCFAIYSATDVHPNVHKTLVERFDFIRKTFSNLGVASDNNKLEILKTLNSELSTNLTPKDVWTSATTVSNQWGYWRNHLTLFDQITKIGNDKSLTISSEGIFSIQALLEATHFIEGISSGENLLKIYKSNQISIEHFNIK
jgi:superfamily II DNA or RNA helicase